MSDPRDTDRNDVQTVIGLEVHVRLQTRTKLFCPCENQYGRPPNTLVCPTCLGLPGALPVINRRAIGLAVRAGLALDCEIPPMTKWDRKQYFYPDLPKGYQISQFDFPVCGPGHIDIQDQDQTRRIHIVRAHLEEDAGKSTHEGVSGDRSRVDLNRCGTPLLEIVSAPDLRSDAQADAYLNELKSRMTHLGVSDCEMQQGSLRVDANVNLHIRTDTGVVATPIVEVKNMNSFRSVRLAIRYESDRQLKAFRADGVTIEHGGKTTRGWDDVAERTVLQREKEESADYRYFPDPDLLPVRLPAEWIDEIRDSMDELPAVARRRLIQQHQIKPADAEIIVGGGAAMVRYFETAAGVGGDARRAAAWLIGDVQNHLKQIGGGIDSFPVDASSLGDLLGRIKAGELDNTRGRDVLSRMIRDGGTVESTMNDLGIVAVDDSEIETLCRELLDANPKTVEDYRAGRKQAVGALIGQARNRNPNAKPGVVRETLVRILES